MVSAKAATKVVEVAGVSRPKVAGGCRGRGRGPAARGRRHPPTPASRPPIRDRRAGRVLVVPFRSRGRAVAQDVAEADAEVVADGVGDHRSWSSPRPRLRSRPTPVAMAEVNRVKEDALQLRHIALLR